MQARDVGSSVGRVLACAFPLQHLIKWVWWPAPVIPALRSGEAGGPKIILLLIKSSRPAWVIETVRPYQKKIIEGKERKKKQVLSQGATGLRCGEGH